MPISNLILRSGQVVVSESASSLAITDTTAGEIFGMVEAVSDLSQGTEVGQIVLFNPDKAISTFKMSEVVYWIINENTITLNEGEPLP